MVVTKAVITAAGKGQRNLPLQNLIDSDGVEKSVLTILIEEVLRAGIDEICLVVRPGDEQAYASEAASHLSRLVFVHQQEPLGHGHAVYCARDFVGEQPFLHLVGDHLYVSRSEAGCAERLVRIASAEACAVSTVHATREHLLPYYGAIGGHRLRERTDLYRVETVLEKPTPTLAEQRLIVPGLRAGHYLCFFGMHVLTPTIFALLEQRIATAGGNGVTLAEGLADLAQREQYLALNMHDLRYDIGVKYGLMTAQIALALNGSDRDIVLARLLDLLAERELGRTAG
ncbi:MAG: UTP--glucose-1-phosphate uridylyltransferase [Caldilineales bacterium]|nr:UTP--glucose-1-phosphate uridylyltransferase [Caldilineales bacterium]